MKNLKISETSKEKTYFFIETGPHAGKHLKVFTRKMQGAVSGTELVSAAQVLQIQEGFGYTAEVFIMYKDPYFVIMQEKRRATQKAIENQHRTALMMLEAQEERVKKLLSI